MPVVTRMPVKPMGQSCLGERNVLMRSGGWLVRWRRMEAVAYGRIKPQRLL